MDYTPLLGLIPTLIFIIIVLKWLRYGLLPGEDLIQDIREWRKNHG